jgi:tRNA threonylcarbamoyl adenosine modification protein (Sua5/YciO/YrdC/YwlC family)
MLVKIHPINPEERQLLKVIEVLENGGVIIIPTDGVYAFACLLHKTKAAEKVAQLKGKKLEKADLSFIFEDLSHLAEYTRQVETWVYKLMKRNLPGPFTFILNANTEVPKIFKNNKKTIGIRIPDNKICLEIVNRLQLPLITASVHDNDEVVEYTTDPDLIHERWGHIVDLVIDGGYGQNTPSAVLDCTGDELVVVREGLKELEY